MVPVGFVASHDCAHDILAQLRADVAHVRHELAELGFGGQEAFRAKYLEDGLGVELGDDLQEGRGYVADEGDGAERDVDADFSRQILASEADERLWAVDCRGCKTLAVVLLGVVHLHCALAVTDVCKRATVRYFQSSVDVGWEIEHRHFGEGKVPERGA